MVLYIIMATYVFPNVQVPGTVTAGSVLLGADPTQPLYAATKQYVDNAIYGINWKQSVRFTTKTNLAGYAVDVNNGKFTGVNLTSTTIFDLGSGPITVALNDRILVKDQIDTKQNGLYYVTDISIPTSAIITRTIDANGIGVAGEITAGDAVFIEVGTINANIGYILSGDGVLTLNTDNLIWVQFSTTAANLTQYALLIGRSGGQVLNGSNTSGQNLTLSANAVDTTGTVIITTATGSSSSSTGALTVAGGVGITGNINTAGVIKTTNSTASTTTSTGSIITSGGVGVAGNVNVGGYVQGGNIQMGTNQIVSTNTNGNISILPNGTGQVLVNADPIVNLGVATKQYVDTTISGKKSRILYPLTQQQVLATSTSYSPVAYFTWVNAQNSNFVNGYFIYEFVQPSNWNIQYQIIDSGSNVIFSGTASSTGFYADTATGTLPTANTRLTLQIKMIGGAGTNYSSFYGTALQFDNNVF